MRWKLFSILITLIGFVFILNSSFRSITGNVVRESIHLGGSIFGLIFIIGGLVLFLANQKAGGLEGKLNIITTKGFDKMVKRVPKKEVENALDKIGTGKGKEEYIKEGKYKGHWSIRTSKGARIYYLLEGSRANVTAYETSSEHR